jgi:hypothetical protein
LKRSQLRLTHLLGTDQQQMFEQRLGCQLWGRPYTIPVAPNGHVVGMATASMQMAFGQVNRMDRTRG